MDKKITEIDRITGEFRNLNIERSMHCINELGKYNMPILFKIILITSFVFVVNFY